MNWVIGFPKKMLMIVLLASLPESSPITQNLFYLNPINKVKTILNSLKNILGFVFLSKGHFPYKTFLGVFISISAIAIGIVLWLLGPFHREMVMLTILCIFLGIIVAFILTWVFVIIPHNLIYLRKKKEGNEENLLIEYLEASNYQGKSLTLYPDDPRLPRFKRLWKKKGWKSIGYTFDVPFLHFTNETHKLNSNEDE